MAISTILFLHSSDDLYGADKILLQIVTGLDPSLFKPIVILPEDMRHVGLLSAELAAHGVECFHLPLAIVRRRYVRPSGVLPFLSNVVRSTWAIRRLVRQRDIRLIHGFTLAVLSAPIASLFCRVPLIMHAHEILTKPRLLRRLLHTFGVRWSARLLCVSEATRNNILEDQPLATARVLVMHNGIEEPSPRTLSVDALRLSMGVPLDQLLVGMIGRVSPWKGQEVFLQAASRVSAENKKCHFVAIGGVFDKEVQHLERLQALHRDLNLAQSVTLLSFMKDAQTMLPAFDLFISPSTSPDPFPTVILEAMYAGVPVIASAHGGPLEMVVDGVTGTLVPPGDPVALAEAIQDLLSDAGLRMKMSAASQVRMREHFTLGPYLERIERTYIEVLGAKAN